MTLKYKQQVLIPSYLWEENYQGAPGALMMHYYLYYRYIYINDFHFINKTISNDKSLVGFFLIINQLFLILGSLKECKEYIGLFCNGFF